MTVYVGNFRVLVTVGRVRERWSHLTADTPEELHAFAALIGLKRAWHQQCKTRCAPEGQPCPHWHYGVTDTERALVHGAVELSLVEMSQLLSARRRGDAAASFHAWLAFRREPRS